LKKSVLLLSTALLTWCCSAPSTAMISERKLTNFKSLFLERIIEENPESEERIRTYLGGMIMDGRHGMRLLDKFGLFLDSLEKEGISIKRIRFNSRNNLFSLFLVMKDGKDEQLYTMFIEYEYGRDARCLLKEIYFSIVFEERLKEIKTFFESR
jgi:hypothetical protein